MFSLKSTIYQTEWLDLVFANRNKSYGAYELRQNYNKRLAMSLLIVSFGVSLLVAYPLLKQKVLSKPIADIVTEPDPEKIIVVDLPPPIPPKVEAPAPAAAIPKTEAIKLETKRFVTPVVVSTQDAVEPPTVDELEHSVISNIDSKGEAAAKDLNPIKSGTGNGQGTQGAGAEGNNEPVSVALLAEYPEFPGGMEAFAKFLQRNLKYPVRAAEAGVSGKVFVSFIVERDGQLTDIKVLRGIGYGCDEEAARVLKKSPAWKPGIQNDRKVRVQYTIPLSFQLGE
ncbi:energy transducer TonB [Paradesertivirga mongoliensis]|uniref:Energy transducer TonB n=1 Tax=Paradesertivirga mongoliensis TaxID=2100740 RepID=A0ABW4ZL26_9SPHI|nr:energy transducer TonB [Pedobacter mongoliensis]